VILIWPSYARLTWLRGICAAIAGRSGVVRKCARSRKKQMRWDVDVCMYWVCMYDVCIARRSLLGKIRGKFEKRKLAVRGV